MNVYILFGYMLGEYGLVRTNKGSSWIFHWWNKTSLHKQCGLHFGCVIIEAFKNSESVFSGSSCFDHSKFSLLAIICKAFNTP